MSRASIYANLDKNPHYGIFNASIIKIEEFTITLKDIFSEYEFNIEFKLSTEYDITKSGKKIWINQLGEIAYGEENELREGFLIFKSGDKKRYWQARKGEVFLFRFLKNYKNLNPFNPESTLVSKNLNYIEDENSFRKLFLDDNDHILSIGGCLYINEEFIENVYPYFIPSYKVSSIKNSKGDFSNLNVDWNLKEFINPFLTNFEPKGYYLWNNISEYNHIIIRKTDAEI